MEELKQKLQACLKILQEFLKTNRILIDTFFLFGAGKNERDGDGEGDGERGIEGDDLGNKSAFMNQTGLGKRCP